MKVGGPASDIPKYETEGQPAKWVVLSSWPGTGAWQRASGRCVTLDNGE